MGDIFKRMAAFFIDWNLCLLPSILILFLLAPNSQESNTIALIFVLLFFVSILASLTVFVLRDVIFKGRSIGKRLFRLHIFDVNTRQQASIGKRIAKNLFFFIYGIDGIVLLVSGNSIGNYVTNTEVISEKTIAKLNNTEYKPSSKLKITFTLLGVITVIVATAVAMFCFIQTMLNNQKDTEEYKLAYSYLIESETFDKIKEYNYSESDIRMSGFSTMTYLKPNYEGATKTTTITFSVDGSQLPVVCHYINDKWQVCEDCTIFH